MICAICGRETEKTIEGICVDCFMQRNSLFEISPVIELFRCPKCGSYLHRGKWEWIPEEESVLRAVRESISVFAELEKERVEVEEHERAEGHLKLSVRLSGELHGIRVSEEKFTEVRVRKLQCERCSRISGGYYEGIIQIRA
ncbi:MAG: ribosomal export protein, partial [Archaeoglobi archaeon]|nr:ribosomal export protein [Archaeoglobi archaeon]